MFGKKLVMSINLLDEVESGWKRFLLQLEYWEGNNYYGIGRILKHYAGLPLFSPINCHIQHGVKFFNHYPSLKPIQDQVDFYISDDPRCLFLINNEDYADFFRRHGIYNVKSIGSPVIYMDDYLIKINSRIKEKKGTIAFPAKGTHYVESLTNYREYAEMLAALPEKFKPIKVCMYYLDVRRGNDSPFREKGFQVVTNGHLLSQDFFYNFFSHSSTCEYATTNDVLSSPVYYSIYNGLKFFRYGPKIKQRSIGNLHKEYARERERADEICPYTFPIELCEDYERQREIAYQELGVKSKLSRKEMRSLLLGTVSKRFIKKYIWAVAPRFPLSAVILESYDYCHDKLKRYFFRKK